MYLTTIKKKKKKKLEKNQREKQRKDNQTAEDFQKTLKAKTL